MKMKRFVSLVMACVLALALAVPAFAESTPVAGQTIVTGTYEEVPIAVSVPTSGDAQINPYGLPVKVSVGEGKTVDLVGQQITTKPLSIKNQGTVSLDVNATLAVVPSGDVSIVASKTSSEVGKEIAVTLEVANANDETLAVSNTKEGLENLVTAKFAADATWEGAATLTAPAAAKGDTAADITPAKSDSPLTVLGAVTAKSEGFTYAKNSMALFRLTGELNETPTKKDESNNDVDDPWTEDDGFTATIVFKFKPHAFVEASLHVDESSITLKDGATEKTLTATFDAGDSDLTVDTTAANGGYTWAKSGAAAANIKVTQDGTDKNKAKVELSDPTDSPAFTDAKVTVTVKLSDGNTLTAEVAVTGELIAP